MIRILNVGHYVKEWGFVRFYGWGAILKIWGSFLRKSESRKAPEKIKKMYLGEKTKGSDQKVKKFAPQKINPQF